MRLRNNMLPLGGGGRVPLTINFRREQRDRLREYAARRGVSMAEVLRTLFDAALPEDDAPESP